MDKNLLNILSSSNKDIDNQKLMDYLSGKLSGDDKYEVEKWMAENDFVNEAVEGLQDFSGKKDLKEYVDQLHKDLNHYIQQKKQRRDRRKIKEAPWVYIAIVFVLVMAVIAYVIIKKLLG